MIDSAEVSAMLDILILNCMFAGFCFGLIFPKIFKLLHLLTEFLIKKLGKDKKEKEKE
ncbi:hypothetical protein [uncultured Eubacterium sp.]|uniref:hypothetical protein n=1 Tax=uncultured Eubacterium sp. TaxID=165185 RepID=UPI0015A97D2B|nr:hypothetical protein [uncultured Eubacterium sp.]